MTIYHLHVSIFYDLTFLVVLSWLPYRARSKWSYRRNRTNVHLGPDHVKLNKKNKSKRIVSQQGKNIFQFGLVDMNHVEVKNRKKVNKNFFKINLLILLVSSNISYLQKNYKRILELVQQRKK